MCVFQSGIFASDGRWRKPGTEVQTPGPREAPLHVWAARISSEVQLPQDADCALGQFFGRLFDVLD